MNIQSYVKSERTKFINDMQYICRGQELFFNINEYNCKIYRSQALGFLSGYVILNDLKELYDTTTELLQVHGGITYNELEEINGEQKLVIGFDCCHFDDFVPLLPVQETMAKYKNLKFVKNELKSLCEQLRKAGIH